MYTNLIIVTILTFILNLPFGYLRSKEKKLSFKWFLYIHLPIPIIVFMRYYFNLGFKWWTYPFLIAAFFSGQLAGKIIGKRKSSGLSE